MPDWTGEYFERGYGQRWGLRPPSDQVRREAAALWNLFQLAEPCRLIDIGCGHGRHALALAERGAAVIGLDFAVALLNRARQLEQELGIRAAWIRGDMRRLYRINELRASLEDAGFSVVDMFGSLDGAPFDPATSSAMWVVAERGAVEHRLP